MMQRAVLPLLIGVAFLVTLDIALRVQHASDAPAVKCQPPNAARVQPAETGGADAAPRYASRSESHLSGWPAAPPRTAAPAESQPDGATAAEPEEKYPPVTFHFAASSDPSRVMVTVRNTLQEPQPLTVTAVDPKTGDRSMVRLNVDGFSWANLSEAGLVAHHGDELSAESPGYSERGGIIVP